MYSYDSQYSYESKWRLDLLDTTILSLLSRVEIEIESFGPQKRSLFTSEVVKCLVVHATRLL